MAAYPAKRFCLVISGHGGGWNGFVSDKRDGLVQLPALAENLEQGLKNSGRNLDVLALDAHWMACGEAVAEFSPCADFLVASQGRMNSCNYKESFSGLLSKPRQTGLDLTRTLVEADPYASRMTGFDLSQAERLTASTGDFVQAMGKDWKNSTSMNGLSWDHFYDLGLVGRVFQSAEHPEAIREQARELSASVDAIIVDQGEGRGRMVHGLNVANMGNEQTDAQRFHQGSGWADMMSPEESDEDEQLAA